MQRLAAVLTGLVAAAVAVAPAATGLGSPRRPAPSQPRAGGLPIRQVRLSAVGDLILGNTPNVPADPYGYLAPVRRAIRSNAGIVFANLEGTLTTESHSKCGDSDGGTCFAFRNPPSFARALHRTGFTVLNDANNH